MKKPRRPKPVFDLPSPAEVNSAAAELSDSPQAAKPAPAAKKERKSLKRPQNAPKAVAKTTPKKPIAKVARKEKAVQPSAIKNPIGRPRANHGRRSTSVMVKPEIWKRLKLLALQRDIDLSEMLEDMFLTYLKKEEKR